MIINDNGLSYILDQENYTANVTNSIYAYGDIFIPRSINYQGKDFLIHQINSGSFQDNQNILSISFSLDSEVKIISRNAFKNSTINALSLPKSIEQLEDGWCRSTDSLDKISIQPENSRYKIIDENLLISIQDEVTLIFACRNITTVNIPSNVTVFGESSFEGCNCLESLNFSEDSQLKKISKNAFTNSTFNSIIIPPKLEFIDEKWNKNPYTITNVEISPKNKNFTFLEEKIFVKLNQNGKTSIVYFSLSDTTEIVIPSNVTKIVNNAFQNCNMLQSVTFEENSQLEEICQNAFDGCGNLSEIRLPKSVKILEKSAFSNCDKLSTFSIESDSKLVKIGENIFPYSNITELFIPDSVETIEEGWCQNADNLCHIQISASNKNFFYLNEKLLIDKINGLLLFANRDIESGIVPATVRKIGNYSFGDCGHLTSLHFEENSMLTEIGDCAFYFCSTLSSLEKVPSCLRIIGISAFSGCGDMTDFGFNSDSKIEKICESAFNSCHITSLFIPESLHILEDGWCKSTFQLFDITVSENNRNFVFTESKLLLSRKSDTEREFDTISFASRNVESIVIPDSVRIISSQAFQDCSQLTSVSFQNSKNSKLEKIGDSAFFDCVKLSYIEPFPKSVTFIGSYCFSGTDELKSAEFLGSEIYFSDFCFNTGGLVLISFPNASNIYINLLTFSDGYDDTDSFVLFIHHYGKIHQSL
ncbi:hypothetical protein M9Y10_000115 [Tritrichomonas musculus]|uniref:Surface antigen BspA-like n=1 Tax=Tritrichomonas musculus TaxID=1915356 RepID=A0ABR2L3D2_9EUKA